MMLLIILTSIVYLQSINAQFFTLEDDTTTYALVYTIAHPTEHEIEENGWNSFHDSTFNLVQFLDMARDKKIPAILVMPDDYQKLSTLESRAPITEGARVALAWASTYFRFKDTDVRVLLCPSHVDTQACITHIATLATMHPTSPHLDRHDQIYDRLYHYENIKPMVPAAALLPLSIPLPENPTTEIVTRASTDNSQKRILITGGSGFIGSHLARWFVEKGYYVIALDNLSCSSKKNIEDLLQSQNFEFHQVDVSQPFDVDGPIDIIVHLAALPSPANYYAKPMESMASGLNGTKITLELAQQKNARYLFASTSEVYGDPEVHPQPETYPGFVDPIGKRSQYDQSKRGAETLIKLYFEKCGMDIRIIRIFNTYGPGMQIGDGRVVTNFIKAALENKAMTVYGTGEQTRSLCYVTDNIDAITRVITQDEINNLRKIEERIFNVGNPEEHTINDVARLVNELSVQYLGRVTPIAHIPQFDQTDPKVRRPDLTRTTHQTGYVPKVSFKEGLEKIFLSYFLTNNALPASG